MRRSVSCFVLFFQWEVMCDVRPLIDLMSFLPLELFSQTDFVKRRAVDKGLRCWREYTHRRAYTHTHARATLYCFQRACRELKGEGEIRKTGRETVSHGASLEASVLDRVVSTLAAPPAEPERVRGTDRQTRRRTERKGGREKERISLLFRSPPRL